MKRDEQFNSGLKSGFSGLHILSIDMSRGDRGPKRTSVTKQYALYLRELQLRVTFQLHKVSRLKKKGAPLTPGVSSVIYVSSPQFPEISAREYCTIGSLFYPGTINDSEDIGSAPGLGNVGRLNG